MTQEKKELGTENSTEIHNYVNHNLFPRHRQDLHEKSGLSYETIYKAGYKSESNGWTIDITDPWTGAFQHARKRLDTSIDGQKYTQDKGTKQYIYFSKQLDWKEILDDPSIPVIIVEGEKKADALIQNGFVAVSISGVYGWSSKKKIINSIKWVLRYGREIILCPDNDIVDNDNVKKAFSDLAKVAYRLGCKVKQINFPRETKGADDFFVYYKEKGKEWFQELLEKAVYPIANIFHTAEGIEALLNKSQIPSLDKSELPEILQMFQKWSSASTHAPDEFLIMGFIGSVAGALGKQVALKGPGGKLIFPNLWISCVGPSGVGKTTALNVSVDLLADIHNPLEEAHLSRLKVYERELVKSSKTVSSEEEPVRPKFKRILLPTISSKEKLYENLALDYSAGLIAVPEELSIIFADIEQDRNSGLKPFFISLYGGSKVAPSMSFKSSADLPLIKNPAVSILGASTLELMFKYFRSEDFYSGFLQRFSFALATSNKEKKAFPTSRSGVEEQFFRDLLFKLYTFNNSDNTRVYELSEDAIEYWCQEYSSLNSGLKVKDPRIVTAYSRIDDEVTFKLALIFHCLENRDQQYVSVTELKQAVSLAHYLKLSFRSILDQVDNNRINNMIQRIIDKLRKNFAQGLSYRSLASTLRGYNNSVFDEAINKLEELKIIEIKQVSNSSNNSTVTKQIYLLERQD